MREVLAKLRQCKHSLSLILASSGRQKEPFAKNKTVPLGGTQRVRVEK